MYGSFRSLPRKSLYHQPYLPVGMSQPSPQDQPLGLSPLQTVMRSDDFDDWSSELGALLGEHRSELLNSRYEQDQLGFQAHLRAGRIADVGVVAIEGVGRTRLDRHQGVESFVLWLPLRGWVREKVNGEELLAEPGMAMLCRPGQHLLGESSARLQGVSLVLPVELLRDLGFGTDPSAGATPVLLSPGPEAQAVITQARQLVALVSRPGQAYSGLQPLEMVQHLCETLFDWESAYTGCRAGPELPSRSAEIVAEAEAWLLEHLQAPLQIGDLARQLELTPRSLQLAFQRQRGCSPMQRLKRLRFQALHGLLARAELGSLPLERLLASVGLPGYGRTRAEFRAWCGSSPQELRHQMLTDPPRPAHPLSRIGSTRVTSE